MSAAPPPLSHKSARQASRRRVQRRRWPRRGRVVESPANDDRRGPAGRRPARGWGHPAHRRLARMYRNRGTQGRRDMRSVRAPMVPRLSSPRCCAERVPAPARPLAVRSPAFMPKDRRPRATMAVLSGAVRPGLRVRRLGGPQGAKHCLSSHPPPESPGPVTRNRKHHPVVPPDNTPNGSDAPHLSTGAASAPARNADDGTFCCSSPPTSHRFGPVPGAADTVARDMMFASA
jgi:hypothetical protein